MPRGPPPPFPDSLAVGPTSARCAVSGSLRGGFLKGCCFPEIPSQASSHLPPSSCLLGDGGQQRAGVCALGDFFQQLPQPHLPPFLRASPTQATLQRTLPTLPGVSLETPFASSPVQLLAHGGWSCGGRPLGPRGRGTEATGSPQEAASSGDPDAWLAPSWTLLRSSPHPPRAGGLASAAPPPMPLTSAPVYVLESLLSQPPGWGRGGQL